MLGPLEVRRDGTPIALAAAKERALLAILLIHRNEPVSTDRIVDMLWGESSPDRADNAVQVYVSHLRKALEPTRGKGQAPQVVVTHPAGYVLRIAPDECDADRFEALLERGRSSLERGDAIEAAEILREGLDLWHGAPLPDVTYEPFAQDTITHLEQLKLAAVEELIDAELALGRHESVAVELPALVSDHPFRERLRRQQVIALYRCGRQAEALAAYRAARDALVEELGVDPTPALSALETAILRQTVEVASPGERPAQLGLGIPAPAPPTAMLGRTEELTRVEQLLTDPTVRLVTLTGPGGAGKTRLALEAAHVLAPQFPDGVWFAGLAGVEDPSHVLDALRIAVGAATQEDLPPFNSLVDHCRDRRLLLVIDNVEHLLDAAPDIATVLTAVPSLTLLATSQSALRLTLEHELVLGPLPLPEIEGDAGELARSAAVSLFLTRAETASGRAPRPEDLSAVAAICRRLDGLPLAIELAAARSNVLTPDALLDRLSEPLALLTDGPRDAPSRQQTLRATIDWSYGLLDDQEQAVLELLSVFPGGATLDALEHVAGRDVVRELSALVDRSLVSPTDSRPKRRFRLLETIREYAGERLRERGTAQQAQHAQVRWCLDVAARREDTDERVRLDVLESELDNLRAALAFAHRAGEGGLLAGLAVELADLWQTRGLLEEGVTWLELAAQSHDLDDQLRVRMLHTLTSIGVRQGDYARVLPYSEQLLALARERGDVPAAVRALALVGTLSDYLGDDARATAVITESLDLAVRAGDDRTRMVTWTTQGNRELRRGNNAAAVTAFREALSHAQRAGRPESTAPATFNLGLALAMSHELAEARPVLDESLRLAQELGDRESVAYCLEGLAALETAERNHAEAARLLGASAELLVSSGARLEPFEASVHEATLQTLRQSLGSETLQSLLREGRSLSVELAIGMLSAV